MSHNVVCSLPVAGTRTPALESKCDCSILVQQVSSRRMVLRMIANSTGSQQFSAEVFFHFFQYGGECSPEVLQVIAEVRMRPGRGRPGRVRPR